MRSPRIARAALTILVAMTAAGGGAAINLALLEPVRPSTAPLHLTGSGASTTTDGTASTSQPPTSSDPALPPSIEAEGADDPDD